MADYPNYLLSQVIEAANKPRMTLNDLQQQMTVIYKQAEESGDKKQMQVVANAWGIIQTLDSHYGDALTLTDKAIFAGRAMKDLRDKAESEHDKLLYHIRNLDERHEEVREAFDCVRDQHEREVEASGGFWTGNIGWEIVQHGDLYLEYSEAERFHTLLTGRHVTVGDEDVIDHDLRVELSRFIKDWLERVENDLARDKRLSSASKKRGHRRAS